jgi:hypothetical protein
MHDPSVQRDDEAVEYWLSRPVAERWAAVEQLRRAFYGWTDGTEPRLQRVLRIVRRDSSPDGRTDTDCI